MFFICIVIYLITLSIANQFLSKAVRDWFLPRKTSSRELKNIKKRLILLHLRSSSKVLLSQKLSDDERGFLNKYNGYFITYDLFSFFLIAIAIMSTAFNW